MNPRWILRLYPRAWRERYGDEVEALLASYSPTWRTHVDLLIGAAHEWVAPKHFRTTRTVIRLATMAVMFVPWVGGVVLTQAGEWLGRSMATPVEGTWPFVGALIESLALMRGASVVWIGAMLTQYPTRTWLRALGLRSHEFQLWAVALFGAAVWTGMSDGPGGPWWRLSPLFLLAMGAFPSSRLGQITSRLARRDRRLKIRRRLRPFFARRIDSPVCIK